MHLAQLNIAKAKAPLDSDLMKEFVDNLAPINAIAEQTKGFVWRLKDDTGDATSISAFDDPLIIVNMSVWESIEPLKTYMYKTKHLGFLKRRAEWFDKMEEASHVLWWVPLKHLPTIQEAKAKLSFLRTNGESTAAFSLMKTFEPSQTKTVANS